MSAPKLTIALPDLKAAAIFAAFILISGIVLPISEYKIRDQRRAALMKAGMLYHNPGNIKAAAEKYRQCMAELKGFPRKDMVYATALYYWSATPEFSNSKEKLTTLVEIKRLFQEYLGPRDCRCVGTIQRIAQHLETNRDLNGAESVLRDGIRPFGTPGMITDPRASGLLHSLARVLCLRGKTFEAMMSARNSAALFSLVEDPSQKTQRLFELAHIMQTCGYINESEPIIKQTFDAVSEEAQTHRRISPLTKPLILMQLAKVYQYRHQYDEAERLLKESLPLVYGPDCLHISNELLRFYRETNQQDKALSEEKIRLVHLEHFNQKVR